jgi:hypothetical protein
MMIGKALRRTETAQVPRRSMPLEDGSFHDATVGDVVDSGKLTEDPDPAR